MAPSLSISEDFDSNEKQHKLSRREKRAFKNKLKKPKYQKLAKKVIQSKAK